METDGTVRDLLVSVLPPRTSSPEAADPRVTPPGSGTDPVGTARV